MKYEMQVINVSSYLNVRSGPGESYEVISRLYNGDKIWAYGVINGFYQFNLDNVRDGWVSGKYLNLVADLENPSSLTNTSTAADDEALTDYDKEMLESVYTTLNCDTSDKIDSLRFLFGAPMQFTKLTDPRPDNSRLGRAYLSNLLSDMSLLTITPGKADFMRNFSKTATNELARKFISLSHDADEDSSVAAILQGKETGRYYSFTSDYVEYMKYVNNMCRLSALFLDIGDQCLYDGAKPFRDFDWDLNNLSTVESSLFSFLTTEKGVSFFIDGKQSSFNDGMNNSTGESMMASTIGKGSDFAKEAMFIFGKSFSDESLINTSKANYDSAVNKIMNSLTKNSTLARQATDRISDHVTTLINGGNVAFPEIYKDSSYNKSYDISIKLVSPYGDKLSIYLYIFVPLFHLIALSFPRQMGANGYMNPFLVRAFCKGWFNCSLGIVDSINIKRASQDGWSIDGLPTEVDVTLSIKDLYQNLALSREGDYSTYNNIEYMDMLSTWCGINLNVPELSRKLNIYEMITQHKITEFMPNIIDEVNQNIANKIKGFIGR